MNQLEFLETLTLDEFKKRVNAVRIGARHNDETGKNCLVYTTIKDGKVETHFERCSSQGIPVNSPMVSRVSDGSEEFWMLHGDVMTIEW